jgi:hypothetical protein
MTRFDVHAARWPEWERLAKDKIEQARDGLETVGLDHSSTESLRGEIIAWRSILELGKPADEAGSEASADYGLVRR